MRRSLMDTETIVQSLEFGRWLEVAVSSGACTAPGCCNRPGTGRFWCGCGGGGGGMTTGRACKHCCLTSLLRRPPACDSKRSRSCPLPPFTCARPLPYDRHRGGHPLHLHCHLPVSRTGCGSAVTNPLNQPPGCQTQTRQSDYYHFLCGAGRGLRAWRVVAGVPDKCLHRRVAPLRRPRAGGRMAWPLRTASLHAGLSAPRAPLPLPWHKACTFPSSCHALVLLVRTPPPTHTQHPVPPTLNPVQTASTLISGLQPLANRRPS